MAGKTTKVFEEEYKGHKLFAVYEVDEDGKPVDEKPLVSFGKKKAEALMAHVDELVEWCEGEGLEANEVYNG